MAFKKLTAGLMASSMILGLAATASAEITTATPFETATKMNKLGVVLGVGTNPDGSIDFNLGGNLTRAELVTTIVRSFGAESAAQLAKGAPSFGDVAPSAWYSGYVAVAKNLAEQAGTTIGRDSNTFDPNANVSKAEALVFVMKFLGIKVESTGANWYEAWIAKAVELGMISADDAAIALANPANSATRGEAFVILDFGYSAKVLEGGKSLYTGFVDAANPVIEVAQPAESTAEGKVTISGKVSDNKGVASLAVNGTAVEVKDGNFSADVTLAIGANSVVVSAVDIAGNTASKTFTVTRVNAAASALEAADITVVAGGSATVAATVKDANGEAISGVTFEGTSAVGTYDAATGTFKAGEKAGEGTLTLKYGELTKEIKVTVTAGELAKVEAPAGLAPNTVASLKGTDAYGNAVSGVTFAVKGTDKAFTDAAGNFWATEGGVFTVVATKGSTTVESTIGVYGDVAAVKVTTVAEAVANTATEYTVKVQLVDADGNAVIDDSLDGDEIEISGPVEFVDGVTTAAIKNGAAEFSFTADSTLVGEEVTLKAVYSEDVDGTVKFTVVEQKATSVSVAAPTYLTTNDADTEIAATVTVLDQEGEAMLEGEWDVKVSISGPATFADGKTTAELSWNTFTGALTIVPTEEGATGDVVITATAEGLTAGKDTVKAVVAQAPAKLILSAPEKTELTAGVAFDADDNLVALKYTVQVADKNGVPVDPETEVDLKVAFADIAKLESQFFVAFGPDAPASGLDFLPASTAANLLGTTAGGKLTFWVAATKAGNFTVQVKDTATSGALTASATSAFSVAPFTAVAVSPVADNTSYYVTRGAKTEIAVQAVDPFGNKVAKKDVAIAVGAPDAGLTVNGKTAGFTVKTDANGVAKVEVVASSVADGLEFTFGGETFTINSRYNIAKTVSVSVIDYVGALDAGDTVQLLAVVKDADGYAVTDLDGEADFAIDPSGDVATDLDTVTWTYDAAKGGYVSDAIAIEKAGNQNFKVTLGNLATPIEGTSRTISVRAGDLAGVVITEATDSDDLDTDADTITVAKNKATKMTIKLVDEFGNAVLGSAVGHKVKFVFSSTADVASGVYASFRDADGNELAASGIAIAANKTGATFYLVTNADGEDVTVSAIVDTNNDGTFDEVPAYSATYTVVVED